MKYKIHSLILCLLLSIYSSIGSFIYLRSEIYEYSDLTLDKYYVFGLIIHTLLLIGILLIYLRDYYKINIALFPFLLIIHLLRSGYIIYWIADEEVYLSEIFGIPGFNILLDLVTVVSYAYLCWYGYRNYGGITVTLRN